MSIAGETMGTTYHITARTENPGIQREVDSILQAFDLVYSTYNPKSALSNFNEAREQLYCFEEESEDMRYVLDIAEKVYTQSEGFFDPTVMPLVRYWGFGPEKFKRNDYRQSEIDSILNLVGYLKLRRAMEGESLCLEKHNANAELDLSAIAKGYGVDKLATCFDRSQISDYMVEIGGEIRTRGKNERGQWWTVGIDRPISTADLSKRQNQAVVELMDQAIASSGNYRNFYELNGRLIGHTINPKSGYPEKNDLLGVSVIASTCIYADALATGFMAMGYQRSFQITQAIEGIEAFFIYLDEENNIKTDFTTGFTENLVD